MRTTSVGRGSGLAWVGDAETFARESPELVVAAVAAVLLLVAVAVTVYRVRSVSGNRLRRVLERRDEIAVLAHPNPDPDAMACAMGVAKIAEAAGADPTLYFAGQIRHQENRAFRTVLDLDIEHVETGDDLAEDDVVLVDHNVPRGFPGADGLDPVAVVDHHPGDGAGSEFTDVQTHRGSCASIVADYFRQLDADRIGPDEEIPEGDDLALDARLATALLFGIQADTKRLTDGCSEGEFEACSYLYPAIDSDRLERIANPQVTAETLEVKAEAIQNREVDGSFAISYVGEVGDADTIPQAADELVRLEGVSAVVVMGLREDTLHLSGRSRDDRVHMGQALEAAVEDVPMASAGGHARMGGGQLSVEHMQGIGPSEGLSLGEFQKRVFACLHGDV